MATDWRKSTCPFCGLGCGVEVGLVRGRVVKIRGLKGHPANNGDICRLPANYPPIFYHKDRLKYPMIRRGGNPEPISRRFRSPGDGFRRIRENSLRQGRGHPFG